MTTTGVVHDQRELYVSSYTNVKRSYERGQSQLEQLERDERAGVLQLPDEQELDEGCVTRSLAFGPTGRNGFSSEDGDERVDPASAAAGPAGVATVFAEFSVDACTVKPDAGSRDAST